MLMLPGYQTTTQLYDNIRTQVYRAIRQSDGQPVVIKLPKSDFPSYRDLAQFRHQYNLAKNLNIPGIIKPYSLETYGNGFALVMEDFGGISLSKYINYQPLPINKFLYIAQQIVQILAELHRNSIIHKDIKPQNLLIHPQTNEIKLIDFSISSVLPRETQEIQNPKFLEGTLAYIAPEQTGRMNRVIDYRSDFYSLGVTFYELVTGQLPFQLADPMELIHCHIAKTPPSPIAVNPTIPQPINDIILKLMAKTAEDRYQSASGIQHDLEICAEQWQQNGIIFCFKLGQKDISDRFLIPEKLYGREQEIKLILEAFERVAQGNLEILLVAGFSGIGKTAVVNEVHKPIVRQKGYFIKGKFEQFNRKIPFSAFVQAFRSLMAQLLAESSQELEKWKAKILAAMVENAQIMIEVVPELELIIGSQPPVREVSGNAAQNRFNSLFGKFIRLFATQEHPLVIFLDDLQWADSASLNLIELLANETETSYLLLMGAYRDNEVSAAHPLRLTLKEINQHTITLKSLPHEAVNHLISDTLSCSLEVALPLTEWIYKKTKGNPFFTNQFLKYLYQTKLITFNFDSKSWQCDLTHVQAISVTDDVVEFMAAQLQQLPVATQTVVKLAACIGNTFDLNTLAIAYNKTPQETADCLWIALQEGLILPINDVYKFLAPDKEDSHQISHTNFFQTANYKFFHDRVQQAAYSLIPDAKKQATHLKIGKFLWEKIPQSEREDKIFEIVNQLNAGRNLISNSSERYELAQLNLMAGCKAKTSTAYEAAVGYLMMGRQLLPEDSWQNQYETTLNLYVEGVEVAYLNVDFQQMDELAKVVLQNAKNLLHELKVYEVQISACTAQVKPKQAVEMGLEVLKFLGVNFPQQPNYGDIEQKLTETALLFTGKKIEEFVDLPEMVEPDKQAALRILSSLVSPAYISTPALLPLIICEMVGLSVGYGNAALSAFGYGLYGLVLSGVVQEIEKGYEFGQLALNVVEKFQANYLKTKIFYTVGAHLIHGKHHLKTGLSLLREAYLKGLETGELETGYSAKEIAQFSYLMGCELTEIAEEIGNYTKALRHLKQEAALNYNQIIHQVVLNLLNNSENPCRLVGEAYDEEKMLPFHVEAKDRNGLHYFYFHKMIVCYLFGENRQAFENSLQAEQYLDAVIGMINGPLFHFYDSLIRLAIYEEESELERQKHLSKVENNQEKIQKWADSAPINFLHKLHLLQAEKYRILGKNLAAMESYDRAIALAKENEYLNEEALAKELAAKFYLAWQKEKIAQTYLVDAYYAYVRWGAKGKVEQLIKCYPELLNSVLNYEKNVLKVENTITSVTSIAATNTTFGTLDSFDMATVIKASQAIASEIKFNDLLTVLMKIVIENAGAQLGALILKKEEKFIIEATGSIETDQIVVRQSILVANSEILPLSVINYVGRTHKDVVLVDACKQEKFVNEYYFLNRQIKSVLCFPILSQAKLIGILYLENNLIAGAFTPERSQLLKLLCSQAAISLENALLYEAQKEYAQTLESKVQERTTELTKTLEKLQQEIVERQQAEVALIDSECKYRDLVETSQNMIFSTSFDGRYTFVNQAVKQIYGYAPQEMIGRLFTDFEPPEQIIQDRETFQQILAGKSIFQYESVQIAKDGRRINLLFNAIVKRDSKGNVLGTTGTASDITERKKAELALQESEERYRRIIETTYEGVWIIDAQEKTTFVNSRMAEMLGYTVEEMLGKHIFDFMDEEGKEIAIAHKERRLQGINENHDFKFICRDGAVVWVIISTTSIFNQTGQYVGSLGMITDISDRKQAEEALRLSEANLKKAKEAADNANRAKSEFLSKMSHELRTPLNAILGFTQLLTRDPIVTEQQQEHLGIISRAGEHLLNLINDVLEMSKIEAGKIELHQNSFDLYRLLDSLAEMFKLKAESKGLQLILERNPYLPQYIKIDESKLRQVLINLLANAIKFTETGKIVLRVWGNSTNQTLEIDNTKVTINFQVEDTGPGITPAELKILFEPFVQTETGRKSQSGTGLGLPISRQFVQLMRGDITVSSIFGKGSIFTFHIQAKLVSATEVPIQNPTRKVIALEPDQPSCRILVVDDIWESRSLLVNLLSPLGFELRQASNGQEAIDIWQEWQPHLIWMDMQMPVMDGYEATKKIKNLDTKKATIIIALTASAFDENRAIVLASGCDNFVSKPFREEMIFEKMAEYLGIHYIYEQSFRREPIQAAIPAKLTIRELNSEDLAILPSEWIAKLYQAASELDDDSIKHLLQEIHISHEGIANYLMDLAKKLRFDKIINLIQGYPH